MHFACGNDPKHFATVLRAISSECREEEQVGDCLLCPFDLRQDLVWARAILQSLCAKNLELAVGLLEESMKTVGVADETLWRCEMQGNNIEFRKIRLSKSRVSGNQEL